MRIIQCKWHFFGQMLGRIVWSSIVYNGFAYAVVGSGNVQHRELEYNISVEIAVQIIIEFE